MTTVHANTTRDALSRLETLVLFSGYNIPDRAIREQIAAAVNVIIQVARLSDGTRRITNISEVVGMEGEVVTAQEIFAFRKSGVDQNGRVVGKHVVAGVRPLFMDQLRSCGVHLDPNMFANPEED